MQWSLFLLILMGQGSFFTCQLYEYHFVNKNKTWDKAQTYCRKEHTDLATVYDMDDMNNMKTLKAFKQNKAEAWIGLRNATDEGKKRTWHWSLPGVEHYTDPGDRWDEGEPGKPSDVKPPENCVFIKNKNKWHDGNCQISLGFICYNETKKSNETFHVYKEDSEKKNWKKAQNYCRVKHTDLISGVSQLDAAQASIPTSEDFWIGLFTDTWRWSNGSTSSFRNWKAFTETEQSGKNCVTVKKNGKWVSVRCDESKPFFCYEDKVILIKQNKTWEEALNYCRENHYDLVSIINPVEQIYVQEKAKKADSPHVWLGLRYTCTLGFWFWISDEVVDYKNWNGTETTNRCGHSGAMDREGKHKWFKKPDQEKFNFICSMC